MGEVTGPGAASGAQYRNSDASDSQVAIGATLVVALGIKRHDFRSHVAIDNFPANPIIQLAILKGILGSDILSTLPANQDPVAYLIERGLRIVLCRAAILT